MRDKNILKSETEWQHETQSCLKGDPCSAQDRPPKYNSNARFNRDQQADMYSNRLYLRYFIAPICEAIMHKSTSKRNHLQAFFQTNCWGLRLSPFARYCTQRCQTWQRPDWGQDAHDQGHWFWVRCLLSGRSKVEDILRNPVVHGAWAGSQARVRRQAGRHVGFGRAALRITHWNFPVPRPIWERALLQNLKRPVQISWAHVSWC